MAEKQRPTAKTILSGIIEAMRGAQEPLEEDLILVPSAYHLELHPEAYQALQPLLPRIREQARKRLDEELARLNSRQRRGGAVLLGRLLHPFLRLLFAEAYVERLSRRAATYERVGEAWRIEIGVTADAEADLDHLVVETDFGTQGQARFEGRPTVAIRRRTLWLPDGRFETVLSTPRTGAGGPPLSLLRRTPSANVLARLSFRDNKGQHVYYMKKDQIVIGRQDGSVPFLDVALDTLSDVSREHARIRRDEVSGEFYIKNVSRFGATVNGRTITSSLEEEGEDREGWIPLPRRAEIGLADAVYIHFEALEP